MLPVFSAGIRMTQTVVEDRVLGASATGIDLVADESIAKEK